MWELLFCQTRNTDWKQKSSGKLWIRNGTKHSILKVDNCGWIISQSLNWFWNFCHGTLRRNFKRIFFFLRISSNQVAISSPPSPCLWLWQVLCHGMFSYSHNWHICAFQILSRWLDWGNFSPTLPGAAASTFLWIEYNLMLILSRLTFQTNQHSGRNFILK